MSLIKVGVERPHAMSPAYLSIEADAFAVQDGYLTLTKTGGATVAVFPPDRWESVHNYGDVPQVGATLMAAPGDGKGRVVLVAHLYLNEQWVGRVNAEVDALGNLHDVKHTST